MAKRYILDLELSEKLAKAIKAKKKECYSNSFKAITFLPEGSKYVEGYGCIKSLGIPLEHAWLLLPDGKTVVDVTWWDAIEVSYSPILELDIPELVELVEKNNGYLPVTYLAKKSTVEKVIEAINDCIKQLEES